MSMNYLKITFFFLVFIGLSFSQSDSDKTVEDTDTVSKKTPVAQNTPKEISDPQEKEESEQAGTPVEIPPAEESGRESPEKSAEEKEISSQQNPSAEPAQDDQKEIKKNHESAPTSDTDEGIDVAVLRHEAQLLRESAERLITNGEKFQDDAENIDEEIDDLEELAEELEDEAAELLKQAGQLQACIKISDEGLKSLEINTLQDDTSDTGTTEEPLKDQKLLMLKMRNSADLMLMKAKEISVQVREMKEASDKKDDLSDKYTDEAEALGEKAEDLDEAADSLEEAQNLLPFPVRYPFQLGHQIRFTTVGPYDDKDANILLIGGIKVSFYLNKFLCIGVEDITLRFCETIYGTRVAICASPIVSFSYFPLKKMELGAGFGGAIQGQVGADHSYDVAGALFLKLFNENWVANRFSLGPVVKINFLAKGDFFTRAMPFDKARVLPEKAWWMGFGITYTFHF